ncbi:hypothetical protein Tco_0492988 [Tanacetum coccineum]
MMLESEVHKFSDGTLTRTLEKLDYMVKDYRLFKFNPGMENQIWTEDDKRRSQEFIKLIERRLKIRRIFRSLKSFVSGRQNRRDLPNDNLIVGVEDLSNYGVIDERRYGISMPALTKDHRGIKLNTSYPEDQYAVLEIWNEYNILEDIKRGTDKAKIIRKQVKTRQTRTREQKSTQKARRKLSKSTLSQPLVNLVNLSQDPKRNATLDEEKAQERWDFILLTLTKKEQGVSITDCHAGNPCEISSDLTA